MAAVRRPRICRSESALRRDGETEERAEIGDGQCRGCRIGQAFDQQRRLVGVTDEIIRAACGVEHVGDSESSRATNDRVRRHDGRIDRERVRASAKISEFQAVAGNKDGVVRSTASTADDTDDGAASTAGQVGQRERDVAGAEEHFVHLTSRVGVAEAKGIDVTGEEPTSSE